MTPQEKTREIACHNCCCSFEDKSKANCRHYNNVWQMYEWTKKQAIEKACKLMQHWILEHDYVDIMELEDYIKQKIEE